MIEEPPKPSSQSGNPASTATAENAAVSIREKLGRLHRELQSRKFLLRAFLVLGGLGVIWLLLAAWDAALSWQESAAFGTAIAMTLAAALALVGFAARLLARPRGSLAEIALRIENSHPELRDALICATELSRKDPADWQRVERALLESIPQSIRGLDLRQSALSSRLRLRSLLPVGLVCSAVLGLSLLTPITRKALNHARDLASGANSGLTVRPGSQEVPRATDVAIRASISRWQNSAIIEYRDSEGSHVFPLFEREEGGLGFTLYGVSENVRYQIRTPSLTSAWFELKPYDPPSIESRKIRVIPPAYTAQAPQDFEDFTDLTVVEGSEILVTVTTGEGPQPEVRFRLEGEEPVESAFTRAAGSERQYTYTHIAKASGDYHVVLSGEKDRLTRTDSHKLTVIPDQPPTIEVVEPGKDLQAGPEEEFNLVAKAVDDFGLGDVTLTMEVIGREPMTGSTLSREEAKEIPKERVVSVPVPLSELQVQDGDIVSYYFTAQDNKQPDAQVARTEVFFIEIVKAKTPQRMDGMPGQQQQQIEVRSLIEGLKKNIRQNLALQSREANSQPTTNEDYQALESHMAELRTSGQKKLKETVDFLGVSEGFELLDRFTAAISNMEAAEHILGQREPKPDGRQLPNIANAVPPAQAAMRLLLQVEQELIQNTMNQQASESQASDLGEQNQPPQPPERQKSEEEIRKELQQMQAEVEKLAREQARLNQQMGQAAKGGEAVSGQQQQRLQERQNELDQRTEQVQKQMEQFEGAEGMSQGLGQAGQEMKQSSETLGEGDASAAQAYGERARDELSQVADQLGQIMQQAGQQRAAQAAAQAQSMAQSQAQAAQNSRQAGKSGAQGEAAEKQAESLRQEQAELKEQYEKLEREMQGLAGDLEKQSPNAARKMTETARESSENGTAGTMERASNALLYQRMERAAQLQDKAAQDLQELAQNLSEVASQQNQLSEEQMAQAMDELQKNRSRMEALRAEAQEKVDQAKREGGQKPGENGSPQDSDKLSEEVGKTRSNTGKAMESLGDRMQDEEFSQLGMELQAPEGSGGGGQSPEGTLATANQTLEAMDMAMQMLRDRLMLNHTEEQARLNMETVPPPERYRRLVEEYFKLLGSGESSTTE